MDKESLSLMFAAIGVVLGIVSVAISVLALAITLLGPITALVLGGILRRTRDRILGRPAADRTSQVETRSRVWPPAIAS